MTYNQNQEFKFNFHLPTAVRVKLALRDIEQGKPSALPKLLAKKGLCKGNEDILGFYVDQLLSMGEVVVEGTSLKFPNMLPIQSLVSDVTGQDEEVINLETGEVMEEIPVPTRSMTHDISSIMRGC